MLLIASELNALASTTVVDLYKQKIKTKKRGEHFVKMSGWFTLGWGILAILEACVANLFDDLIQLVNIIGSIFYGNVLGIFLFTFFVKFVKGNAVSIEGIITQLIIICVWYVDWFSFLWLNAFGAILVIPIAVFIQFLKPSSINKNVIS